MKVQGNLTITGETRGITFSDGSTTFERQPKLTFGASDFYLGGDGDGYAEVHLKHPGLRVSGNQDYNSAMRLSFSTSNFYLTSGSTGEPVVNIRFEPQDTLQIYSETPGIGNTFLDTCAPYNYTITETALMLQSGTATVGFYLVPPGSNKNGTSISGLDPLSVTSTKQIILTSTAVKEGEQIKMSITAASSAKQLRVSAKATRA